LNRLTAYGGETTWMILMWYDAFTALILIVFTWKGAAKGAIWQLAVIGSITLCIVFAGQLTPHLKEHIPFDEPVKHWVAVGVVYLGLSLVVFLVCRQLKSWIDKVKFGEYDKHWGAILGLIKGVAMAVVLTGLLAILVPSTRPTIRDSYTGIVTRFAADQLSPILPAKVALGLNQALHEDVIPTSDLPSIDDLDLPKLPL
jgi:membrane protein required for colicin V production